MSILKVFGPIARAQAKSPSRSRSSSEAAQDVKQSAVSTPSVVVQFRAQSRGASADTPVRDPIEAKTLAEDISESLNGEEHQGLTSDRVDGVLSERDPEYLN